MTLREYLNKNEIETPAFYFDLDVFRSRIALVRGFLPDIPLTFSVKANPFLIGREEIGCRSETASKLSGGGQNTTRLEHVEACSPGELGICIACKVPEERIIYSGVNKGHEDVRAAIGYGVDIVTAESPRHVKIAQAEAARVGRLQKLILRLSSGNQFGMSEEDILTALSQREKYPDLVFYGLHYYSGTQNRLRQIGRDLETVSRFLERAEASCGFIPGLVEIGPGLPVEYFHPSYDEADEEILSQAAPALQAFASRYPLGIEMGRFLAAPCGTYATRVKDLKGNSGIKYAICDGGIHQLRYHGQTLAMQVPEMELAGGASDRGPADENYCICGSLCTVADVLVREVSLPRLKYDDVLLFHRCGAYSVTEGSALFLSREIPAVYIFSRKRGLQKVRSGMSAAEINRGKG